MKSKIKNALLTNIPYPVLNIEDKLTPGQIDTTGDRISPSRQEAQR